MDVWLCGCVDVCDVAITAVRKMTIEKFKPIVNDLNRTKREEYPDLAAEQEERAKEWRAAQKAVKRKQAAEEKRAKQEHARQAELRSYSSLMASDNMTSNAEFNATTDESAAVAYEEDFM